ncbi:MAG: non-heme iron oxygenase ferredoxin subunit [Candidatus Omnitrophica bacterium]|nr:non-heme iron oxygenase ferredoxin subunit [Candidatus Omnitrophota bacterium]
MNSFKTVAKVSDVGAGRVKVVEVEGKRIALCNLDGTIYAIDDLCTHDNGPLGEGEIFNGQIECPRHGARFDVKTGKVTCLPAVMPVKTYEVKVEGTEVKIKS